MSYNMHQGYYEQDKMCYSEQGGYGRSRYGMPRHHHNHNQAAGWTNKVTECESSSSAGYNHGGYAPTLGNQGYGAAGYNHGGYTPTLANQGYGGCYERKEEMCMAQGGGFRRRGAGYHRRRVMRHSVSRGEYSSSESDSD